MDYTIEESTALELMQVCQNALIESGDTKVPVFIEDEEGQVEPICFAWYDSTRKMLRLSLRGIRFTDYND